MNITEIILSLILTTPRDYLMYFTYNFIWFISRRVNIETKDGKRQSATSAGANENDSKSDEKSFSWSIIIFFPMKYLILLS